MCAPQEGLDKLFVFAAPIFYGSYRTPTKPFAVLEAKFLGSQSTFLDCRLYPTSRGYFASSASQSLSFSISNGHLFVNCGRTERSSPLNEGSCAKHPQKHRTVRHADFARCNTRTSHRATRRYRTVRLSDVAPCDSPMSHRATPRSCTLRLLDFTPCNVRVSHRATQKALLGVPF